MNKVNDIVFWGATGQSKVLAEIATFQNLKLVALIDNRKVEPPIHGIPVLHGIVEFEEWLISRNNSSLLYGAVAIGGANGLDRLKIMDLLEVKGINLVNLTHKSACVSSSAILGRGVQILVNATVGVNAQIGSGVIVNSSATVEHDCILADGVHIGPGAVLAGEVSVGECAFIGAGAVVLPRVKIGKQAIVGAGSVVTKNVQNNTTVVGNPARVLTIND